MNLGKENETIEFKESTGEVKSAMDDLAAMLNKHTFGKVYFGVKPNGDVCGQTVSASSLDDVARTVKEAIRPMIYPEIQEIAIDGKPVIVLTASGTERPYSSFGRYYKRVVDRAEEMTPSELRRAMIDTDYSSAWENNLTNETLEDVDEKALRSFYERSLSCGRLEPLDSFDPAELLTMLGLLCDGKLTNAGRVLFSKKKPVVLKMAVYLTDERIAFTDLVRLEDNIFNLIDEGLSYLRRHMDWRVELGEDDLTREEIPEVPVEALREVVVNSFAHANYRGETEHEIDITPTEIEIYNPGEFPENLTPEDFAYNRMRSIPRNKKILDILFRSKSVEIQGSGLKKTYALCQKAGIDISYRRSDYGFSFVFSRGRGAKRKTKGKGGRSGAESFLAPRTVSKSFAVRKMPLEEKVLEILKAHPDFTREAIGLTIGKSPRTVQRVLEKLKDANRLVRVGSTRTGYYQILENKEDARDS